MSRGKCDYRFFYQKRQSKLSSQKQLPKNEYALTNLGNKKITIDTKYSLMPVFTRFISYNMKMKKDLLGVHKWFQTRPYSSSYSVVGDSPLCPFQDKWLCPWTVATIQTRRVWFDLGYSNMVIYTILYCYSTPFPHIIFRFTYF